MKVLRHKKTVLFLIICIFLSLYLYLQGLYEGNEDGSKKESLEDVIKDLTNISLKQKPDLFHKDEEEIKIFGPLLEKEVWQSNELGVSWNFNVMILGHS